jgi:hypothetical protein
MFPRHARKYGLERGSTIGHENTITTLKSRITVLERQLEYARYTNSTTEQDKANAFQELENSKLELERLRAKSIRGFHLETDLHNPAVSPVKSRFASDLEQQRRSAHEDQKHWRPSEDAPDIARPRDQRMDMSELSNVPVLPSEVQARGTSRVQSEPKTRKESALSEILIKQRLSELLERHKDTLVQNTTTAGPKSQSVDTKRRPAHSVYPKWTDVTQTHNNETLKWSEQDYTDLKSQRSNTVYSKDNDIAWIEGSAADFGRKERMPRDADALHFPVFSRSEMTFNRPGSRTQTKRGHRAVKPLGNANQAGHFETSAPYGRQSRGNVVKPNVRLKSEERLHRTLGRSGIDRNQRGGAIKSARGDFMNDFKKELPFVVGKVSG